MPSDKKLELPAYMTVEAALVIPAAIFGIVLIIYMAFMVYGRCVLSQDVYILGFRAYLLYEKQGYSSPCDYVTDHSDEKTGSRYFGSSKPEIKSSVSGKDIRIDGSITTNHRALFGYFSKIPDIWKSEAAARVKIITPAKTMRKMKRAKDIITQTAEKSKKKGKP
ncbi:TadE family protein [Butyrivibrio sp. INlla16]|uniref:TadE family protein n=1 Tax=Butyrivibrio sp. INlla16 TaxID=1520807 RepID=UPI00088F814D|nr:TadE family protein [Butyrivibrio sp. INlla16]SDB54691.1 hypothetical protein SAMN02910263_02771 [Butyrivibrio sp. INlla16]